LYCSTRARQLEKAGKQVKKLWLTGFMIVASALVTLSRTLAADPGKGMICGRYAEETSRGKKQ
jgi:hypothetical protein